jgi:predicted MPP superfamily phosphohydrolase
MPLTRRQFLRRAFWSTATLGLGGAADPTIVEPGHIETTHQSVKLPGWPAALEGFTVAHITDLHRSALVSRQFLADAIERVNALHPDLLVVTGDYLTDDGHEKPATYVQDVADCFAQARATHGVIASLGNHDHWFNADLVTQKIQQAGIPVLRNQNTTITVHGAKLSIVGLGDLWTEGVDMTNAFRGLDQTPAIVLMHNPDTFEHWTHPGTNLILAGHTHGGQVNIPVIGPPLVPSRYGQKYAHGLFRQRDSLMYVNRGLGVIWPGVRFNCRPEIAVFHLHSA